MRGQRELTDDEVAAYVARLGLLPSAVTRRTGIDAVARLQRAHVRTVPFENLDIVAGRPIELSVDAFLDKVVRRRRGGFCYELNGLFHALLRTLGTEARLVEAVSPDTGDGRGPRHDHARIVVQVGDDRWFVDVGTGASPAVPLRLGDPRTVVDGVVRRRVVRDGDGWRTEDDEGDGWVPQWWSADVEVPLTDFAARCRFQETAPDSHFTQGLLCTLPTDSGKVTCTADRLQRTVHGEVTRIPHDDPRPVLAEVFGIPSDAW